MLIIKRDITVVIDKMSASGNTYRMMILLEEEQEIIEDLANDNKDEKSTPTSKKMHDFVEELILPFQVDELDALNEWFDKFDEEICIPNEGHIKYEITSDGLIILILDKDIKDVVEKVQEFVSANS